MREHRWTSQSPLPYDEIPKLTDRLALRGLSPAHLEKDLICYIEEWEVSEPKHIHRLDPWPTEDVTLIHVLENWRGDFFLLAGGYHTVFQRYQSVNTYCSLCHPWRIEEHLVISPP